ncbi:hypothetical protein CKJ90_32585, partial [Klebsiella pneumoniae]
SPEQWQEKADQLAKLFIENFEKYTRYASGAALVRAAPMVPRSSGRKKPTSWRSCLLRILRSIPDTPAAPRW